MTPIRLAVVSLLGAATLPLASMASSHREAPFITSRPKVDATDLYMFNSYEPGRAGYVTLIANYQPFENPQGGPNYYTMDPRALYEIHIDNNGSGKEALTFQFRFKTTDQGLTVRAGGKAIPVPLSNIGAISAGSAAQNVAETYTVTLVKGDRRTGAVSQVVDAGSGSSTFTKPFDNIGAKSIPNYAGYAAGFIHSITIPGCSKPGRVFVGQRQDPLCRQSRRNLRPGQHQVPGGGAWPVRPERAQPRAELACRLQRDLHRAGGPGRVPDFRQRAGHRRLDDREPAAGGGAQSGAPE